MSWQTNLRNRGVRSPVDIGFLVASLALITVGWIAHRSATQFRTEAARVEHTYEVMQALDRLRGDLSRPGTDTMLIHVADELATIQRLTADNPAQQRRLDDLRADLNSASLTRVDGVLRDMLWEEQQLLRIRRVATDESANRSSTIILLSTILAVGLMAVALALLHADLDRRRVAEVALIESESKYRLLVEQAADAILIVNSEAVCEDGNARAAEILGRPQSEIRGLPLSAFVRGSGRSVGPVLPMLRYGHVTTGEFWVARPDGKRVAVEIRATILEDGRVQVIARDISERKEVERVKDEFVSVVSHELRTPLTSIRGALGLLAAGRLDDAPEKRQRMLELAASNTDRLIRLINDILDIERMSSGGVVFERADLSAAAIVEQALEMMRTLAERAGVSLRSNVVDLHVFADADRLTQTLTNLIDNAVKYSPAGETIDVSVRRDGGFARFSVRDRGRGIPGALRASVFERFQQVDNSDSREKGGSGLGLAICRSIVEQHGGRIWIEDGVGPGTVFCFTIPLTSEERATAGGAGTTQVLVCDDDADLLEVLRATLDHRGYHVLGARRGKDAIAQLDAVGADVAIVDVLLPDISGLRVLRHIHSTSPSTKILVYTATYLEGAEKDFIRGIGAVIVTKGRTSPDELADEVERLVSPRPGSPAAIPERQPQ